MLPIITVTKNGIDYIDHWFWCIRNLTNNDHVIVGFDDGSTDGTYKRALELKRTTDQFYQMPVSVGQAICLNAAVRLIRQDYPGTEFFAIVESDIFVSQKGTLDAAVTALEKDPKAYKAYFPLRSMRDGNIHCGTSGSVIRMQSWIDYGGFPNAYYHWCEDVEFSRRAEANGWHNINMDKGYCVHITGAALTDQLKNARNFMLKHDLSLLERRSRQRWINEKKELQMLSSASATPPDYHLEHRKDLD